MTTQLTHKRGDTFEFEFDLSTGWEADDFTGGIVFTVRESVPAVTVADDSDALVQVSATGGGIVFSTDTHAVVTIAAELTKTWPKELHWDIEARITSGARVHTLDQGTIKVNPDITRGPAA